MKKRLLFAIACLLFIRAMAQQDTVLKKMDTATMPKRMLADNLALQRDSVTRNVPGNRADAPAAANPFKPVGLALTDTGSLYTLQGFSSVFIRQKLRFDIQVINEMVQVKWTVAPGDEAKSVEVERTEDGVHFTKIGSRLIVNKAEMEWYDFVDVTPKKNTDLLYRIKLNDRSGSSVYSDAKTIRVDAGQRPVYIKPNPVHNTAELELTVKTAGNVSLLVVSAAGQKMFSLTRQATGGVNRFSLPVNALTPGIYQLVIEAGYERKVVSFVKE